MFKDKTKSIIKDSLTLAKFSQERARMKRASMQLDYYNNDQMSYVLEQIRRLRVDNSSDKYASFLPLTHQIIEQISVMFMSGMNYQIKYQNTNFSDVNNKRLSIITKQINLMSILTDINTYVNLNSDAGILLDFNNETKKISLRLVTSDLFFVQQSENDPNIIESLFIYQNPFENTPNRVTQNGNYTRITNDQIVDVSVNFSNGQIKLHHQTSQQNPLGFIPFVIFNKQSPINNVFSKIVNPLPQLNKQINLEVSRLNWITQFQAFSPLVLTNADKSSIEYGANKVIMLTDEDNMGKQMDAKFISPNISFTQLDQLIVRHMERAGQLMGIGSSAYRQGSTYSSGYQLRLAKEDIVRLNRKQKPLYVKSIKELFQKIIKMNNLYTNNIINQDYQQIIIQINDPQFDISEQQKQQSYARRIALGLTSPIQILSDQMDISEQQATKIYQKILSQNKLGRQSVDNIFDSIRDFE